MIIRILKKTCGVLCFAMTTTTALAQYGFDIQRPVGDSAYRGGNGGLGIGFGLGGIGYGPFVGNSLYQNVLGGNNGISAYEPPNAWTTYPDGRYGGASIGRYGRRRYNNSLNNLGYKNQYNNNYSRTNTIPNQYGYGQSPTAQNVVPRSSAAPPNVGAFFFLTAHDADVVRKAIAKDSSANLDVLDVGLKGDFTVDAKAIDAMSVDFPADKRDVVEKTKAALKTRDVAKLRSVLTDFQKAANPPFVPESYQRWVDVLTSQVETRNRFDDLKNALSTESSAGLKQETADRLLQTLTDRKNSLNLSATDVDKLQQAANRAVQDVRANAVLDSANIGSPALGSNDARAVVLAVPPIIGLMNGDVYMIGQNAFLAADSRLTGPIVTQARPEEILGMAVVSNPPIPDVSASEVNAAVIVENPAEAGGPIRFTANGAPFDLRPGMEVKLRPSLIEFDRGGGFGNGRYSLDSGKFYFASAPNKGWDLFSRTYKTAIDNTSSRHDFHYIDLADGLPKTVRAGQTTAQDGHRPIDMIFDRGDGADPARKQLENGSYKVAVNSRSGLIDLFESANDSLVPAPVAPRPGVMPNSN